MDKFNEQYDRLEYIIKVGLMDSRPGRRWKYCKAALLLLKDMKERHDSLAAAHEDLLVKATEVSRKLVEKENKEFKMNILLNKYLKDERNLYEEN